MKAPWKKCNYPHFLTELLLCIIHHVCTTLFTTFKLTKGLMIVAAVGKLQGGGLMGEWDSFKGSLKSGWRWGHPQGQGVRTAFYVLCKCYNKRLAASHMCGGKQSRVAVAFAPKLDKPHKRRASRGTGTTGQWSQKSATVCHHPPFSLHRCGAALPLNLF